MSNEDPFFPSRKKGQPRTVIRPRPGGQPHDDDSRPAETPAPSSAEPAVAAGGPKFDELASGPGLNTLEAAACPVINAAVGLRQSTSRPDLSEVRERITRLLKQFRDRAEQMGHERETIRRAHYALCAFIDEIVLSTPWGGQSRWQEHSLLSTFHRQTWGGEEFFNIVDRAQTDAARNRDLLELLYLLLALGFEGRYAAAPDGRDRLEQVRESLFQGIRNQRPELERDLSLRWQGTDAGKPGLAGLIPLWAFAAIGAGILLLAYLAFSFSLNRASDPLLARVHALDGEVLTRLEASDRAPSPDAEDALVTLRQLLADDIQAGRVTVEADGRRAVVRVAGDGLFASGSPRIEAGARPIIERIGDAVAQVPGSVLVTGHSDNVPIFSARYPSNWHLSEARARSVVDILRERAGYPERYDYEGRADTEPLASNDTPEGRARNRRVDIAVLPIRTEGDEQ